MPTPVYLSINEFPGTGAPAPTEVDINFAGGYISRTHVKARLQNDTTYERVDIELADEDFITDFRIAVPASVPAGWTLQVYRDTPKDAPLVDYAAGARITEGNLDLTAQQAVFCAAEANDQLAAAGIPLALAAATDAIAAADAAAASQSAAAASASAASASQSAAATSAAAANTSRIGAETAEDGAQAAQAAAEAARDAAAASQLAAAGSASAASASESSAQASEDAARASELAAAGSAVAAAGSASTASTQASAAGASAAAAAGNASAAATSASSASGSATSAANSAAAAASSAASANAIVTGTAPARPRAKPSLRLDFVNTAGLDPRVTFTRASTATYIDRDGLLKTATVNEPRFEHDPLTGERLGLLVEGGSTNSIPWSQGDLYVAGNGTTPPSVSTSVTHLGVACSSTTFPANSDVGYNGCRFVSASPASVTMPAGQSMVGSSWISLGRELVGSEAIGYYWFGCPVVTITSANSAQFVGRWVRVQTNDDVTLAQSNQPIMYVASPLATPLTAYWCRHQIEYGLRAASSYIPTTSGPATRAADHVTVGSAALPDFSSGSIALMAEGIRPPLPVGVIHPVTAFPLATLSDGTSANRLQLRADNQGRPNVMRFRGGVIDHSAIFGTSPTSGRYKIGLSGTPSVSNQAAQGMATSTVTGLPGWPTINQLEIGWSVEIGYFGGAVSRIHVYNTPVSALDLQGWTV